MRVANRTPVFRSFFAFMPRVYIPIKNSDTEICVYVHIFALGTQGIVKNNKVVLFSGCEKCGFVLSGVSGMAEVVPLFLYCKM